MRHTTIPLDDSMVKKIETLLTGTQTISRFVATATEEKVKRMEARNERARFQIYEKDVKLFMPLVEDILKRLGK